MDLEHFNVTAITLLILYFLSCGHWFFWPGTTSNWRAGHPGLNTQSCWKEVLHCSSPTDRWMQRWQQNAFTAVNVDSHDNPSSLGPAYRQGPRHGNYVCLCVFVSVSIMVSHQSFLKYQAPFENITWFDDLVWCFKNAIHVCLQYWIPTTPTPYTPPPPSPPSNLS